MPMYAGAACVACPRADDLDAPCWCDEENDAALTPDTTEESR